MAPFLRAEAYTPTSDDEVLERLPPGLRSERAAARDTELAGDLENLKASLLQAARYVRSAEAEGDLRFHGYARALLRPWWNATPRPFGIALLQARMHLDRWEWNEAESALVAMDAAETVGPASALLKVEIALGRGNLDWARTLVDGLGPQADARARIRAEAELLRRSGDAAHALARVQALKTLGVEDASDRLSDRLLQADLLRQLGRAADAESLLREARELVPGHVRWLEAMADLLLDGDRPAEVIPLLERASLNDALELRVLEAWARLPAPDDAAERARRDQVRGEWGERVERRRDRGDVTALPLLVRASLRVKPDPAQARDRARELWESRPDYPSVRWVLEASGGPEGDGLRRQVEEWRGRHRAADARWPSAPGGGKGAP